MERRARSVGGSGSSTLWKKRRRVFLRLVLRGRLVLLLGRLFGFVWGGLQIRRQLAGRLRNCHAEEAPEVRGGLFRSLLVQLFVVLPRFLIACGLSVLFQELHH